MPSFIDADATFGDCIVSLSYAMKLRAVGSDSTIIYHANPSMEGLLWYDSVIYKVTDGEDYEEYYCAGGIYA